MLHAQPYVQPSIPEGRLQGTFRALARRAGPLLDIGKRFAPDPVAGGIEVLGGAIEKFSADICVSSFDYQGALMPLEGSPAPVRERTANVPVFYDGVRTCLSIKHSGRGDDSISLNWLEVEVTSFKTGRDPFYSTKPDAMQIFGAGRQEVLVYYVDVRGDEVGRADRVIKDGDRKLTARSENLFDMDPPDAFAILPKELPLRIYTTITAKRQGFYETRFQLQYEIGGHHREWLSDSVRIYRDRP